MSNAISGVGTSFKRGDGTSNEGFVALAEVNTITGPGMSRETIDVTSLDSTGGYREYIGGFRDGGDVSLNMNYTVAGYSTMLADFQAAGTTNYQIVFVDGTTIEFAAFVSDLPLGIPPDDKVTMDVTLKVTGQVTLTTGS